MNFGRTRSVTPDFPREPETERAYAISLRDALIAEGGRPTRSVQTFDASQADPESVALYDVDHGLYELYVGESAYWDSELWSWNKFLRCRPKLNLRELQPSEIFTEYLAYQEKRIKRYDEKQEQRKRSGLSLDSQWRRDELVDRLDSIRQQLMDIQKEQADTIVEPETPVRLPISKFDGALRRSPRLAAKRQRLLNSSTAPNKIKHPRIVHTNSKSKNVLPQTPMSHPPWRSPRLLRPQGVTKRRSKG